MGNDSVERHSEVERCFANCLHDLLVSDLYLRSELDVACLGREISKEQLVDSSTFCSRDTKSEEKQESGQYSRLLMQEKGEYDSS